MTVFLVTLLLTVNGTTEKRELMGFNPEAAAECAAKKRQHEFTDFPRGPDIQGIAFYCDIIPVEEARV